MTSADTPDLDSGPSGEDSSGRRRTNSKPAGWREDRAHERLADLIRRGAHASGHPELGDALGRHYLEKNASREQPEARALRVAPGSELEAVLEKAIAAGPSRASLATDAATPQTQHKPQRGRGPRTRKPRRRPRREAHAQNRQAELKTQIFGHASPGSPDIPELRPEVRAANLAVTRDGTGRRAIERLLTLPHGQTMAVAAAAYAAAPKVRRGQSHHVTRVEVGEAALPTSLDSLTAALRTVRQDVSASVWFRRLVSCAAAPWFHRVKLTPSGRVAARGGVYTVQGFCQKALAWLVPKADGTLWSRSALFREDGPFMLLGAASRGLGREVAGPSGVRLWTRWQPPARVARHKGPPRFNPVTGKTEQFGLAQHRYDAAMSGRTTLSLARRARGRLREIARAVVSALAPWIELPEPRRRPVVRRAELREVAFAGRESAALPGPPARGPP